MKPISLDFCGIKSFSEPAHIDFESLLESGIFGIFGDTGAGKSTILECIGFALYGGFSGVPKNTYAGLLNYKSQKGFVRFEFEIDFEGKRRRYIAEREISLKQQSQQSQQNSVCLYERTENGLEVIAQNARTCTEEIVRIVGLNQSDFEKCIILPQGEFAQFVRSARSDRVNLVARLFDLDKFGEKLKNRVSGRYDEERREWETLAARMEPYADATQAYAEELEARLKALEKENAEASAAQAAAHERENLLTSMREKTVERESAESELRSLEAQSEEMERLGSELSRLTLAKIALDAVHDGRVAKERLAAAEAGLRDAEARVKRAEKDAEGMSEAENAAEEAEIDRLTQRHARAVSAESLRKQRDEATRRMKALAAEWEQENARFPDFDYDARRAEIDARIAALGEGDFLSYARAYKAELLRGEYAELCGELDALAKKYPQTAEDVAALTEKYGGLAQGDRAEIGELVRSYNEREHSLAKAKRDLVALDAERGKYTLHLTRLGELSADWQRLQETIAEYGDALKDVPAAEETERALEAKKRARAARLEAQKKAGEEVHAANIALAAARERQKNCAEEFGRSKQRYFSALEQGGFSSPEEARSLAEKYGDPAEAQKRVETYRSRLSAAKARAERLKDVVPVSGEALEEARRAHAECRERSIGCAQRLALTQAELARAKEALEKKKELEEQVKSAKARAEVYERLKKILEGNKFMEFVAEEYLQTVAVNASARLLSLTDGRYFLRYEGGFSVGDNFNGGNLRPVYTLSGGETFLVSLSLALALSAEICSKSLRHVEFFFLDEGFGTLDERLVDTVMDSLEKLKGERFSIGIISHVEGLKHRIDRKLTVYKATETHGSQIKAE